MFFNRVSIDFSEVYKKNLFTDLKVTVGFGTNTQIYHVHKVIMCASSTYFLEKLAPCGVVNGSVQALTIEMQPHLFEAYLNLIYDGCAIIGEEDLLGFRQALEIFGPFCLPTPDDPAPIVGSNRRGKKPKLEPEVDEKPSAKPKMELDLDNVTEEQISKKLIGTNGTKDFACKICDKKFQKKVSTFDHIMAIHRTVRDYECVYCIQSFATSNLRSMHVSQSHSKVHRAAKALAED